MSTAAAPKKTPKPAALAGVKTLPAQLRALADQIERLGPLLNAETLKTEWKHLTTATDRISKLEAADLLAPLEDYLACRHGWLDAWAKAAESITAFCKQTLGAKSKAHAIQPGEDNLGHQLRLLGLCLNAAGREAVLNACTTAQNATKAPAPPPSKHINDTEARGALHQWGGMLEDEFLALAKTTDPTLLKRGAALLGFKTVGKTAAALKKLHRAAVQFHRNTRV